MLCFMVYFSVENFKVFLQEYFDGALKPYIKSEPVPESNDKPVKVTCESLLCCCHPPDRLTSSLLLFPSY